jgi:hypothetical protein
MSMNHSYAGLPKVPASANLPRKPDPQHRPLNGMEGNSFQPAGASMNLWSNAQRHTPAQYPATPTSPPDLPRLSSTTKDILARVQSERSTPAGTGPPKGLFRDTNPIAGLLPPSIGFGSTDAKGLLSSTSTFNDPAAGLNPSVQRRSTVDTSKASSDGPTTDSDPFRRVFSHPTKPQTSIPFNSTSLTAGDSKPGSSDSTIKVTSNVNPQDSTISAPASTKTTPSSSSSSRRQREYVLQDGTIVKSGKGLGRGRPGIKRGPRKPKLNAAPSELLTTNVPAASSGPGKKRRRSILTEDEERIKTRVSVSDDVDSDDYTPKATHTRSGRHTQKPSTFVPTDTPGPKKPRLAAGPSNAPGRNLLIKKKVYRGREQNALCERCLRGRGPVDNAIVFCDGCNLCWHQKCHDPSIPKELVLDKTAEWFCKDCVVKRGLMATEPDTAERQSGTPGVDVVNNAAEVVPPSSEQPLLPNNTTGGAAISKASAPLIGAHSLTLDQRHQYLASLSQQELLDVLLHVTEIAPDLPIFPDPAPRSSTRIETTPVSNPIPATVPNTTATPQPPATAGLSASPSTITHAMKPPPPPPLPPLATSSNPNLNPSRAAKAAAPKYTSPSSPSSESAEDSEQEEEYDEEDYAPSHSKCYPKPGHGLMSMLPPDRADEHMLLEGPESRTFSHSAKGTGTGVFGKGKGKGKGPAEDARGLGEEDKENWGARGR